MAQSWCARNLFPGRPGIEYLWPGTWSSIDWRPALASSSLSASSRHLWTNSLLIILRTRINTELVFSGSRTSSLSSTCFRTSLAPVSVFISSSMISFSCSDVSWADGLIFRRTWISSQWKVFHTQASFGRNIYGCNRINSIHSIRTYINTSIILLPTILRSLLSSTTLFKTFQSLCKMIGSCAHVAFTQLAGITIAGLVMCSAISFLVAGFISTIKYFRIVCKFQLESIWNATVVRNLAIYRVHYHLPIWI